MTRLGKELGSYLCSLNSDNINLADQPERVEDNPPKGDVSDE